MACWLDRRRWRAYLDYKAFSVLAEQRMQKALDITSQFPLSQMGLKYLL